MRILEPLPRRLEGFEMRIRHVGIEGKIISLAAALSACETEVVSSLIEALYRQE